MKIRVRASRPLGVVFALAAVAATAALAALLAGTSSAQGNAITPVPGGKYPVGVLVTGPCVPPKGPRTPETITEFQMESNGSFPADLFYGTPIPSQGTNDCQARLGTAGTWRMWSASWDGNGHRTDKIVGPFEVINKMEPSKDVEVELVPPGGYEEWMPQADEDEKTRGNYIEVGIVAHKKGDPNSPPPKKVLSYKIELQDTSREKGVDLNWPPKDRATNDFDMKIDKDNLFIRVLDDKGQAAEADQPDLTNFSVTVNSYDWGGWTKLRVTAELEDNSTEMAHVLGHPNQDSLAIPKDDNSNHIADAWEHLFKIKNTDASADDDDKPTGDGTDGDSVALYDEYRGFHIQGRHERLSPEIKDLFVWDQDNLGVGLYHVTGVNVHVVKESERAIGGTSKNHNIVTPNGSHGDVCALWLKKGALEGGVIGETVGADDVPCNIESITIDEAGSKVTFGDKWQAYVQSGIAHELSHATNVKHHGPDDLDYVTGDVRCHDPDGTVTRYACNKTPKDKNGKPNGPLQPADDCFEVAVKGGKFSGNDQCWMRYDETNFYEDPAGACEWQHNGKTVYGSLYGKDPPGMSICESQEGTGVNDPNKQPNKAGNATYGKCKQQIRLKNRGH